MKTTVKVGIAGALIWIIINLIFFLAGQSKAFFDIGILFNVFMLMATIGVGAFLAKKEIKYAKTFFLNDFKGAMQSGVVYAIVIASFLYVYHEKIDPSIRTELAQARLDALHEQTPDEATYFEQLGDDDVWKNKSFDDYIENQEDQINGTFSSISVFLFHLMGLLLFSFFYSFFIVLILRKVVLKEK